MVMAVYSSQGANSPVSLAAVSRMPSADSSDISLGLIFLSILFMKVMYWLVIIMVDRIAHHNYF